MVRRSMKAPKGRAEDTNQNQSIDDEEDDCGWKHKTNECEFCPEIFVISQWRSRTLAESLQNHLPSHVSFQQTH